MKTSIFHYALFALIGLVLSPLAVAHASPPFDYEQWRRDHPRPAAKRLANLNVGEPRTVRMIYFLPNDWPYRAEVVASMKTTIRQVQTFYAEQMQAHGYGKKTFRFETDAQGEPLVHRVDGQHSFSHYDNTLGYAVIDELAQTFDFNANVYFIVLGTDVLRQGNGEPAGGVGNRQGKNGGHMVVPDGFSLSTVAHELGHAFGLLHDFRDDAYIMSYGWRPDRLSACAAEFLAVHTYFNPDSPIEEGTPPTIELVSSPEYPAGSKSISVQLKVSDPTGVHQVILFVPDRGFQVKACRGVPGKKEAVVQFEYDGVIPSWPESSLSSRDLHSIYVWTIDTDGWECERI